ncbi:glycoside hydrolase family 36 N-terminal domain-containing protein [Streptomyces sp. L7]
MLRFTFHDEQLGLSTVLHYETVPGTDVVLRRTEFTATRELRLERLDSAAVNIPITGVARLTYLTGQWSQEFQRTQLDLPRGTFTIGSLQGVPGHAYAPWLAVQDGEAPAAYGIALAWPGNWHMTAEAEPGGAVPGTGGPRPARGRGVDGTRRNARHPPTRLRLQPGRPRRTLPRLAPLRTTPLR